MITNQFNFLQIKLTKIYGLPIFFYLKNNNKLLLLDIYENVVTFKKADATIPLSKIDFGETTDIYFEFKTAIPNGLLIDAVRYKNHFRVELRGKKFFENLILKGF